VVAFIALVSNLCLDTQFTHVFSALPTFGKFLLGTVNFTVFGQDWIMFLALHGGKIHFATNFKNSDCPLYLALLVPQAWTLGVELSFYALAPFIVTKVGRIWIALSISIAARAALFYMGLALRDPWTYRFFPSELTWFMLGALSMQVLLPKCERFLEKKPQWTWICVASALALLALYPVLPSRGSVTFMALMGVMVVLLPVMFIFQNHSAFDKYIGELSYPIYICHMLVAGLTAAALAKLSVHQFAVVKSVQVIAVVAVAYGLNRFIAEPIEKLRALIRSSAPNQKRKLGYARIQS
jgi:peptidoglycan/LPS O-acetylase OafA/YrhL